MKNTVRLPFLALAIVFSVSACKGNKSGSGSDSSKTGSGNSDTAAQVNKDTTVKTDTIKSAIDTANYANILSVYRIRQIKT